MLARIFMWCFRLCFLVVVCPQFVQETCMSFHVKNVDDGLNSSFLEKFSINFADRYSG